MRRSPTSSCSSSSSCVGSDLANQSDDQKLPKAKRARKNQNKDKSQNANAINHQSSARRSSIYRGVTRHRWTGRYEAHLWDKSSWNNIQSKKGRQVYLGAYDNEEAAARTYDLAALKYWGPDTILNFSLDTYTKELEEMQKVTKEEYLASLRRRSSGFSRGVSKYRGVARHHHNGRWEARIGRVLGSKYLYLGTYNTQEEAAAAYDMAAIEYRGANAVTNFDISHYIDRMNIKILSNKPEETIPPNSSAVSSEEEEEVEQHVQQEDEGEEQEQERQIMVCPQIQYLEPLPCVENSTMVVMDPSEDHVDLPWCFLDSGFASFQVLDFPMEKASELPDLFGDIGFEDNIDMIFETNDLNVNGVYENSKVDVDVSKGIEMKSDQQGRRLSISPSCSTTTSLSNELCV